MERKIPAIQTAHAKSTVTPSRKSGFDSIIQLANGARGVLGSQVPATIPMSRSERLPRAAA